MNRRTFDALIAMGGVVLTVLLLAVGGLALWGHQFANDSVQDQLVAQKIYFPEEGNEQLDDPRIGPYINEYAGEQLTTGAQAKAYADHFIGVHLEDVADGQTYAEVSLKSVSDPDNAELAAQAESLFKGEALRSALLSAYAFWQVGQIALYAAISAFVGAGVMLVLAGLGFLHLRRTSPSAEVLPKVAHPNAPKPATA
ncbi:hypothetical protein [Streptomyces blattellae]|uniref:hypothetical protein n=1 Tax=Streptomyces blattellae TaxID=2569855 RepID=UPI0012B7DB6F|nr:hypothetical protein [Streptomyces blattellae]